MFICGLDHLNIVFEVKIWAASIRQGFIQDFCFLFFVFFLRGGMHGWGVTDILPCLHVHVVLRNLKLYLH